MSRPYQVVKFKTIDGVILRGRLYPAAHRGPAVILTPGYNTVVINSPPGVPEEFQKAGITALIYDPRSTGKSGGFPRNDIDPFKQAEDYSDAFIFLSKQPMVDPEAIVFWGVSMSAGVALANAAIDRRIAAVIAIAPIFEFNPVKPSDALRLKQKLMKDREAQVNDGSPPYILPILESVAFLPYNSHVNTAPEAQKKEEDEYHLQLADLWKDEMEDGEEIDPSLTHNAYGTTIQSYHRMFLWEPIPRELVRNISPTPVFFLTPELDQISSPERQIEVFESLEGPKRQLFAPGKEHLYVLNGPDMPALMKGQIEFIWQVVKGRFKSHSDKTTSGGIIPAVSLNGVAEETKS
ncbi:Thiohydrolase [Exophiala dermatitidis]